MSDRTVRKTAHPVFERLEARQLLSGTIFGVTTDDRLVQFDSDNPSLIFTPVNITGLASGDEIIGIDVRPSTKELYALGKLSRIYKLNPQTGQATSLTPKAFAPAIKGKGYDLDFDPVTDVIRVMTNTEQNYRINPDTGAVTVDAKAYYSTSDPNKGVDPNVSGLAYSNNFVGAGQTTLYGIDTGTDTLLTVGTVNGTSMSPDSGRLFTVGQLGVDLQFCGFDIGFGGDGTAYAAISPNDNSGQTDLYTVNLQSGLATKVGTIGAGGLVREIAVAPASVRFATDVSSDYENSGPVTVTVVRTSGSDGPLSVPYSTADGSATAGQDYVATSGVLNFADGQETATISVTLLNDADLEGLETFSINLTGASAGTTLVAPSTNTVTIGDDDPGVNLTNANGVPTLEVIGTPGNDNIRFLPKGGKQVEVLVNNVSLGVFNNPKEMVVVGREGDDDIVLGTYKVPTRVFGDAGNDVIVGGPKNDVLIGGPGNDNIAGANGKDVLIGGDGLDSLNGNKGADLVIAGPTTYDTIASSNTVRSLLGVWAGKGSLSKRWNVISNGGSQLYAGLANDDGFVDGLFGNQTTDAFYANTSGGTAIDALPDRTSKEPLSELT